ncbi:MSH4 [Symbiodinium pilosum]|uniref:MSH4 protein n=1 Tax=Symbiodinium pilosum TaxID=2952 RepID=A0A812YH07_SYMPI|nr:MSH4 [Symbiodinium pilosum]
MADALLFVAAAAFTALYRFAEASMDMRLQSAAVNVTFHAASQTMVIDSSTARLLELVRARNGKSLLSLFACRTAGGQHLLRQSLLAPPVQLEEIQARQCAVEELLQNEPLFFQLQSLLPQLADLDALLGRLTLTPRGDGTADWCKIAVRTALRLRSALAALPSLADALPASEGLLADARGLLSQNRFRELHEELDRVLEDSSFRLRGSMGHLALMYAVKKNASALLDVARQTWSESMDAIHNLHRRLAVKYPELNLRLEYTEKRGWYLSHARSSTVPCEFFHTSAKGSSGRLASTTRELNSENFKLRQAEAEILKRSVEVLATLLHELRSEAALLHRASQATAVLDLVAAFAGYALEANCVRPEMQESQDAPLAIQAGRHPLLDRLGDFEPVDFFVDGKCHFQLITGHNGGGKTTYLATMAQLVILAHVGCFVPANYAAFRLVPSLFTRMGTSDSIEASASSFLVEMQEASYILKSLTSQSLVLVDELGRGTSHADGLAICCAVCERLMHLRVYTLFATHFFEICGVLAARAGFRSMHLEILEEPHQEGARRRFCVQRVESLQALAEKAAEHYGLKAAAQLLPEALLERSKTMATQVHACLGRLGRGAEERSSRTRRNLTGRMHTLQQLRLLASSSLSPEARREVLRQLQTAVC